jgi:hypothetical protein
MFNLLRQTHNTKEEWRGRARDLIKEMKGSKEDSFVEFKSEKPNRAQLN